MDGNKAGEKLAPRQMVETEMAACHAALMHMLEDHYGWSLDSRLNILKLATNMMRAQTGAVSMLSRLKSESGVPPTPEILKTNVPEERDAAPIHRP